MTDVERVQRDLLNHLGLSNHSSMESVRSNTTTKRAKRSRSKLVSPSSNERKFQPEMEGMQAFLVTVRRLGDQGREFSWHDVRKYYTKETNRQMTVEELSSIFRKKGLTKRELFEHAAVKTFLTPLDAKYLHFKANPNGIDETIRRLTALENGSSFSPENTSDLGNTSDPVSSEITSDLVSSEITSDPVSLENTADPVSDVGSTSPEINETDDLEVHTLEKRAENIEKLEHGASETLFDSSTAPPKITIPDNLLVAESTSDLCKSVLSEIESHDGLRKQASIQSSDEGWSSEKEPSPSVSPPFIADSEIGNIEKKDDLVSEDDGFDCIDGKNALHFAKPAVSRDGSPEVPSTDNEINDEPAVVKSSDENEDQTFTAKIVDVNETDEIQTTATLSSANSVEDENFYTPQVSVNNTIQDDHEETLVRANTITPIKDLIKKFEEVAEEGDGDGPKIAEVIVDESPRTANPTRLSSIYARLRDEFGENIGDIVEVVNAPAAAESRQTSVEDNSEKVVFRQNSLRNTQYTVPAELTSNAKVSMEKLLDKASMQSSATSLERDYFMSKSDYPSDFGDSQESLNEKQAGLEPVSLKNEEENDQTTTDLSESKSATCYSNEEVITVLERNTDLPKKETPAQAKKEDSVVHKAQRARVESENDIPYSLCSSEDECEETATTAAVTTMIEKSADLEEQMAKEPEPVSSPRRSGGPFITVNVELQKKRESASEPEVPVDVEPLVLEKAQEIEESVQEARPDSRLAEESGAMRPVRRRRFAGTCCVVS